MNIDNELKEYDEQIRLKRIYFLRSKAMLINALLYEKGWEGTSNYNSAKIISIERYIRNIDTAVRYDTNKFEFDDSDKHYNILYPIYSNLMEFIDLVEKKNKISSKKLEKIRDSGEYDDPINKLLIENIIVKTNGIKKLLNEVENLSFLTNSHIGNKHIHKQVKNTNIDIVKEREMVK